MDGYMFQNYLFSQSQKLIWGSAFFIAFFFNKTFLVKLMYEAFDEHNYAVLVSAPFILVLVFVIVLNLFLLMLNRLYFKSLIAFIFIVSASSSYFIDSFGTIIDKDMLNNMVQTDSMEVFDLMTVKLFIYLLFGAVLPILFVMRYQLSYANFALEIGKRCISTLVIIGFFLGMYVVLNHSYGAFFRNHKELRMYVNPIYPVASFVKFVRLKLQKKPIFTAIALDAQRPLSEKKKLTILIVGETARAESFSLNGYNVPTNPLLDAREDIVSFSHFYSCGTATAVSVPCMFSKFTRTEFDDTKTAYENAIDVAQRAGVRVLWRDNNSGGSKGVADRVKDVKYYDGKTFDEVLFEGLQESINEVKEDTLVVLHQEGSHGPTYFKRYPEAFKKFTPACDTQDLNQCTQQQIINSYNNTILYTDYIINSAIELLKKNEQTYQTTLMYLSDHGESLGEKGVYLHGIPYLIAPDAQKHIPAIVYFGNENREKLNALKEKKSEHFSHDNLFHTLLGLFEIRTKEYQASLDMLAR